MQCEGSGSEKLGSNQNTTRMDPVPKTSIRDVPIGAVLSHDIVLIVGEYLAMLEGMLNAMYVMRNTVLKG